MKQIININNGNVPVYSKEELETIQAEREEKRRQELLIREELIRREKKRKRAKWLFGISIVGAFFAFAMLFAPGWSMKIVGFLFYGGISIVCYVFYLRIKQQIEADSQAPVASAGDENPVISQTQQIKEPNQINQILNLIVKLKSTALGHNNDFVKQLNLLQAHIGTITDSNLSVPQYIYEYVEEILEKANRISDKISPDHYDEFVKVLTNGLISVNKAFEKIISQNFNENYSEIDSTLEALKAKLNIDGYLN